MGDLIRFPGGGRIPEGAPIEPEDVSTIQLLDSIRSIAEEGKVRRFFVVSLPPDGVPVYLWCNLDNDSMAVVGHAMKKKSESIIEWLRSKGIDKESGLDRDEKHD